jgi:lipopolysaccharide transport system permease protein
MKAPDECAAPLFKPGDCPQDGEALNPAVRKVPMNGDHSPETVVSLPIVKVIEGRRGWRGIDWTELRQYRDLLRFLIWREIKVRYAQSAIGIGWAVIEPVFSMLVFTIIFGRLAKVSSDGAPYAVFSLAALVPWSYFSNALVDGVNCLVTEANMLRKIYFPRMLMPLSAVFAKLVDFGIAMLVLFGLMAWYRVGPNGYVVFLPMLVLLMMLTAAGLGLWLTALAVQYRDVKHAMSFLVRILMYGAPVVYPANLIPERYQLLYAINPMVGVIEGFRAALLGTRAMPWDFLAVGTVSALIIAGFGTLYFRSRERLFADVA